MEDCCLHHLPPEIDQKSLHKQEIQSHSNHNFPLYNSTVSYISESNALCTFNTLGAEHTDMIFFHRCTAWNYRVHNYVLGAALPAQSHPFSDVHVSYMYTIYMYLYIFQCGQFKDCIKHITCAKILYRGSKINSTKLL